MLSTVVRGHVTNSDNISRSAGTNHHPNKKQQCCHLPSVLGSKEFLSGVFKVLHVSAGGVRTGLPTLLYLQGVIEPETRAQVIKQIDRVVTVKPRYSVQSLRVCDIGLRCKRCVIVNQFNQEYAEECTL